MKHEPPSSVAERKDGTHVDPLCIGVPGVVSAPADSTQKEPFAPGGAQPA
jgi:hypothetical protein